MTNNISPPEVDQIGALQEELRQAQQALTKDEHYRILFETMPQGVIFWDQQGKVITANPAAQSILGLSLEQLRNIQQWQIIREDGSLHSSDQWPALDMLKNRLPLINTTFGVVNENSVQCWIKTSTVTQFLSGDEKPYRIFSTFESITPQPQAGEAQRPSSGTTADLEARVKERTAELEATVKELETFSYSVSHDLRAPLRTIDGFSRAILEDYSNLLDAEGQNYLQRIRNAARQMGQLIDDLLKLSRVTRGEMHWDKVNLTQMAHASVLALKLGDPERKVTIRIDDNMLVNGDPRLLRVVLDNLLDNAWKFTSKVDQAEIHVGCMAASHGKAVYFVRDNGSGFDMSYVNKLFGPFQRLHTEQEYKGTGMGLATVQRIIRRHGGQIWAESNIAKGATFYFTLESATAALERIP